MKKYIIMFVAVVLMICMCGCGKKCDNNESKVNKENYELVSTLKVKNDMVDTSVLIKYDGILYGKSYIVIDYANTGEPIGKIDKLIDEKYIPKLDGETNTKEILNALVYEKDDKSLVINYNNTFELFAEIER